MKINKSKINKSAYLLAAFFILLIMGVGFVFAENGWEKLRKSKEENVYYPEMRDLYNEFGLTENKELSAAKLLETENQVIYTDRIFNINRINTYNASYASDIAHALLKKTGMDIYIMPIPERGVFEEGYESERSRYKEFTEKLENAVSDSVNVLNPLPELEEHSDEYIYFRTENNWTMRGAFYGAQTFFESIGYEKENLKAYREYVFGTFGGDLWSMAFTAYGSEEIGGAIENMEEDPLYIYIKGSNPNREEVSFENSKGKLQTIRKNTIQLNSAGTGAVIAPDFLHSIVEGRGEENLLLITDRRGKMMISYLSELFGRVYVSNIYENDDLVRNLESTIDEYDIKYIIWAQDVSEMGDKSYMNALNPLLEEGGA